LVPPHQRPKHLPPPGPLAVLPAGPGEQTTPQAGEGSSTPVATIFVMLKEMPHPNLTPATSLSSSPLRQTIHSRRHGHDRENLSHHHPSPYG
jgi:hypothetical protein